MNQSDTNSGMTENANLNHILCEECEALHAMFECCSKKRCKSCYNAHKRKQKEHVYDEPNDKNDEKYNNSESVTAIDVLNYTRSIKERYDEELQEAFNDLNNSNLTLESRIKKLEEENESLRNEIKAMRNTADSHKAQTDQIEMKKKSNFANKPDSWYQRAKKRMFAKKKQYRSRSEPHITQKHSEQKVKKVKKKQKNTNTLLLFVR